MHASKGAYERTTPETLRDRDGRVYTRVHDSNTVDAYARTPTARFATPNTTAASQTDQRESSFVSDCGEEPTIGIEDLVFCNA